MVVVDALRDEPFTIEVSRTRGLYVDTLRKVDRGNDLDRLNGRAFVTNCLDGGPDGLCR